MTPRCPACDEPMKEHGRAFECGPCRQIIIFFAVSDAPPYSAADAGRVAYFGQYPARRYCPYLRAIVLI
jgi:hypothetical protein